MARFVIREKKFENKILLKNSGGKNEAIFGSKLKAERFAKNMSKTTILQKLTGRRDFGKLIIKRLGKK